MCVCVVNEGVCLLMIVHCPSIFNEMYVQTYAIRYFVLLFQEIFWQVNDIFHFLSSAIEIHIDNAVIYTHIDHMYY